MHLQHMSVVILLKKTRKFRFLTITEGDMNTFEILRKLKIHQPTYPT